MQNRGLGKGLESLLGSSYIKAELSTEEANKQGLLVAELTLDVIRANPDQPRRTFDEAGLAELAASIAQVGVIQPILVRKKGDSSYQIIAGERRFRAAALAGLKTIPAIVSDPSEEEVMAIALIENLQRQDLNSIDEAKAYEALMLKFSLNQDEISRRVGKNRATIANALRLLKLPAPVQTLVESSTITAGHAKALLSSNLDEVGMIQAADAVKTLQLSVRETEEMGKKLAAGLSLEAYRKTLSAGTKPVAKTTQTTGTERVMRDPDLWDIEETLITKFGSKVRINGDRSRGRIEIDYYNNDDLDRIVAILQSQGSR